jgi:hypothetical protein
MLGTFAHRITKGLTLRNVGIAAALLVMVMMLLLAAHVPDSRAARAGTDQKAPTVFKVGKDVVIPAGDVVSGVVAIGGNVTIDGTADEAVVAVGGDVTVNGTVKKAVVAVGGDVTVAPGASVGSAMKPGDSAIVAVGGKTVVQPGAAVTGKVTKVEGLSWSGVGGAIAHHGPWTWSVQPFGIVGGLGGLVFLVVAALVVAAALPKQMAAVKEQVNQRFFPSLGWGALTAFVIIPVIVLILVISIIGILPLLIVVAPVLLALSIFAVVCVAGVIGDRVMGRSDQRDNTLLVAVIGALILGVAAMIPVAGSIIMAVAGVVGLGATLLAVGQSQRERRERSSTDAAGTSGPSTAQTA